MFGFVLMVERHPDNATVAPVGYLRELDAVQTEAAPMPPSEVLPEYPHDAGEDWGLDPQNPPVGIGLWSIKAVAIIPRLSLP